MIVKLYRLVVVAATLALSAALAASLLNRIHPAFDSLAHFRMHILAATIVLIMIAAASGFRKAAMSAGVPAIVALAMTAPYLPGFGPGLAELGSPLGYPVRIVDFNARFDNTEPRLARDVILAADPDIVILQEATDTPASLLALLSADYPVRIRCQGSAIGGTAVITRFPLTGDDAIRCFDTPQLTAIHVGLAGHLALTVASYHARWPWPHGQKETFENLRYAFAALPHPLVIGGDFNAAPWSEGVQRVARASGTTVTAGYRPTWLTPPLPNRLRPVLGLPIDQLLVSDEITVIAAQTLPFSGSDHLPVLYKLTLN